MNFRELSTCNNDIVWIHFTDITSLNSEQADAFWHI